MLQRQSAGGALQSGAAARRKRGGVRGALHPGKSARAMVLGLVTISLISFGLASTPAGAGPAVPLPPDRVPRRHVAPTLNLTKVVNAIHISTRSLSAHVMMEKVALTQPVTISVRFTGQGSARITQTYTNPAEPPSFVYNDPEGDGNPRRLEMDFALTEPKPGGGAYSYTFIEYRSLDPLYDVKIDPVTFYLYNDCVWVGHTIIYLYWWPPDRDYQWNGGVAAGYLRFTIYGGKSNTIFESAWTRARVSASENLHMPQFQFYSSGYDWWLGSEFIPGAGPLPYPRTNLIPGRTQTVKFDLKSSYSRDKDCVASFQYTINYQLVVD